MTEHPFTDQDVRKLSSLRELAESYVQGYTGDFHVIRACRDRLLRGQELETAHVRLVLNVMRADPTVAFAKDLLPSSNVVPFTPRQSQVFYNPGCYKCQMGDPHGAHETAAEHFGDTKRYRPAYYDITTKMNYPCVMSTHKRSEVIHAVDHKRTTLRYYPRADKDRYQLRLYFNCGEAAWHRTGQGYRFLTQWEASQLIDRGLMRSCPRCLCARRC